MVDINPVQIQRYLGGMDYPASKQSIIEKARENNAPEDVIRELQNIPEDNYQTPADLSQELGNNARSSDNNDRSE